MSSIFVNLKSVDVKSIYDVGKKLGEGAFG